MIDPDATLAQVMNAVVLKWGTAAPLVNIAAHTGWNAKWEPAADAERLQRAARLIAEAAELVEQVEKANAKR